VRDSAGRIEVPFGSVKRELDDCGDEIRAAVDRVIESGWFILGPEVEEFEAKFSGYLGGSPVVGVGSGTEAIHLALVAAGVEAGDYVVTVPNTAVPTASAISAAGATPLLVDIASASFTMDPERLRELATEQKPRLGRRLKAIVPVHLYGQCADMDPIMDVAREFELVVVEDAAQASGAEYKGRKAGTIGDFGAFSFYPSKNLGCYGDGGAVLTQREEDAQRIRMLRNYGQTRRYYYEIKGINSRLGELQAAILTTKLQWLDSWNERRRQIADSYRASIGNPLVRTPATMDYAAHAWHLYVIRHPERDRLAAALAERGVATLIHYPVPIHLQRAYSDLGLREGAYPVAEAAASEVLSLPMFPQLTEDEIAYVCRQVDESG
jgi:dTDP-4-amino-4,6-dideoxygalactose transaminase